MSTFLGLVNDLREKCGISGNALTSLSGLSGESLRCKNWINDAYMSLQRRHPDWDWLRSSFTFTTTGSQQTYSLSDVGISATYGMWVPSTFRSYITASGYSTENYLTPMGYDDWRNAWQFGASRNVTGRPVVFSILPNKSIGLGPTPDATGYTIIGDYFTAPVEMSADSDSPAFPSKFHQIIVFSAMMGYAAYEAAPEVFQRGEAQFNKLIVELEIDQLPDTVIGGALA